MRGGWRHSSKAMGLGWGSGICRFVSTPGPSGRVQRTRWEVLCYLRGALSSSVLCCWVLGAHPLQLCFPTLVSGGENEVLIICSGGSEHWCWLLACSDRHSRAAVGPVLLAAWPNAVSPSQAEDLTAAVVRVTIGTFRRASGGTS